MKPSDTPNNSHTPVNNPIASDNQNMSYTPNNHQTPQAGTKKVTVAALGALSIGALSLVGCQSNGALTNGGLHSSSLSQIMASQPTESEQSLLAKHTLMEALQKQRKSAYRYRMDMIGSNQARLAAFDQVSEDQLAMSDIAEEHCEHIHDQAYADLIQRAQLEGADIDNSKYSTQREALKSAFIECKTEQVEWENARYDQIDLDIGLDSESDYADSNELDDDLDDDINNSGSEQPSSDTLIIEETSAVVEDEANDIDENEDTAPHNDQQAIAELLAALSGVEQQDKFLPNYDSAHTKLDAHKAKLLDAYLLKPTSVSVQGVYQPLLGKMSVTPTLRYQGRNLTSIANHYLYIDAKQGAVYIWADTYAYLLSVYFDQKLGTSMHNKWLKLDLNDGSLPEGFGRDFIASHFYATDQAAQQIPAQRYKILTNNQLLNAEQSANESIKFDSRFLPYLKSAPYVIERRLTEDDVEGNLNNYFKLLHQQIREKYPELVEELKQEAEESQSQKRQAQEEYLAQLEQELEEAAAELEEAEANALEAEIMAASENDITDIIDTEADDEDAYQKLKFDSRKLVSLLLTMIENNTYEEGVETNNVSDADEDKENEANKEANKPNVRYSVYNPDTPESSWLWRDIYAIDNNQRIQWHFKQYKLKDEAPASEELDVLRAVELQSLTRYEPVSITAPVFTSLPEGATTPNAANTIDIREYTADILQRYRDGEGNPMGQDIIDALEN